VGRSRHRLTSSTFACGANREAQPERGQYRCQGIETRVSLVRDSASKPGGRGHPDGMIIITMTISDRIEIDPAIAPRASRDSRDAYSRAGDRKKWREENREAIQAYNEYVEKHGAFSDDMRQF
jgi:post-segregation antitoxin CcdA